MAVDDFEKQIAKVAKAVADKAATAELPEATDALKVLTQLYALKLRHQDAPEDTDDETFGGMAAQIAGLDKQEQPNGAASARVRARPRRADS